MINILRKLWKKMYLARLKSKGLKVGMDFQMEKGVNIDAAFPWLIEIGDNVTLASWVYIVAHDGASKKKIGYSRVGRVRIGHNVFIGARSIIMPGVTIGDNSIVGAGSIVTKSIPEGTVYAGNPAKYLMSIDDYIIKLKNQIEASPVFEQEYTLSGGINDAMKEKMRKEISEIEGFIV